MIMLNIFGFDFFSVFGGVRIRKIDQQTEQAHNSENV